MRLTRVASPSPRVGRLAVRVGIAFAIAMALVGLIGFIVAERWVTHRIDVSLREHAAKYLALGGGAPVTDAAVAARIEDWQRRKVLSERTYVLFGPDGRRIAGRLDIAVPPPGLSIVRFRGGGVAVQEGRALATRLPSGSLLVVVQRSQAATALRALLPQVVLAISLVASLLGIIATWLFAHVIARRLAVAQRAADAIAAGDLSRRIPTDDLDGMFAAQAEALNRMLDRMEHLVRAQRLFSSNLAHDLRSPLTRLRGTLRDGAASTNGDGRTLATTFERAERECAAIIGIFDALLRLAEIESGQHPTAVGTVALRPLIEDIADTMEPVLADRGGRVTIGRLDDACVQGDADLINQMLVNLLENVATHAPRGTRAELSAMRDGDTVVMKVRDDGPGLAPEDRVRVTRPFERGAASTGRRGSGLGLAIVQAIVRFHHGHLALRDAAPGLIVEIRLPQASASV